MPLPEEKTYTIEDIYSLPEGTRAELIDGRIYYMAPPSGTHQKICGELHYLIKDYIRKKDGSCEVYAAPYAVFLNKDDINYVEPDLSVICDPSKLDDKGCHGAPDWIIEIVSPGNPEHDYLTKLNKYWLAGVREYWIVDPRTKCITVYFFETGILARHYTFNDTVSANIYEDLTIDFGQLAL
ncbi:MAG TPA: Uma2 family endonuclease [Candidatus Limivivens intestinipullorum]|uniref:Uma2 family endonuclease n=1 Tax=Candidatus Limivivens intestinipullorum TaxID=2840858 RepID=A0A9D1JJX4_9FIRM|nr:Uma2 family endonuclease [Candidatus Limivivens intestinipullorum]